MLEVEKEATAAAKAGPTRLNLHVVLGTCSCKSGGNPNLAAVLQRHRDKYNETLFMTINNTRDGIST